METLYFIFFCLFIGFIIFWGYKADDESTLSAEEKWHTENAQRDERNEM